MSKTPKITAWLFGGADICPGKWQLFFVLFLYFGADHPSATSIARLGIKLSAFVRSVQAAARFHAVLNAGMPIEPKIVHDTFAHHAQHIVRDMRAAAHPSWGGEYNIANWAALRAGDRQFRPALTEN